MAFSNLGDKVVIPCTVRIVPSLGVYV